MIHLAWDQILEISKILYGLQICTLVILGSDLILRYLRVSKEIRARPAHLTFFIIGIGVLGTSVYSIFALIDYVFIITDIGFSMQALIPMVILTIFTFILENLVFPSPQRETKRKYRLGYLTIIAIGFCIYAVIFLNFNIFDGDNIWDQVPFYPVYVGIALYAIVTFVGFITLIFYRLRPKRKTALRVFYALVFGIIAFLGVSLRGLGRLLHNEFFFIGTIIEISGWIGMRHYILSIPSYSELENPNDPDLFSSSSLEHYGNFFANPLHVKQFEELKLRFSRQQGPGQPPRGEFSAIIILLLNNPDVFGGKVRGKQNLQDAITFISTKVLNLETNPERIRKNTVNHLKKLKALKILEEEEDSLSLTSKWQTLL